MISPQDKRTRFRRLHEQGCFVIANPWDIGTTRYMQHLGFKALATSSAGFAFSRGYADGAVPRDVMLAHIAEIVANTDLPVNADFESGYAQDPDGVTDSVRLCVETGVAGLSIEDATGDKAKPLYDLGSAVARIKAARAAIDASGADVLLTGRAEGFLVGKPDIDDAMRRLRAYSAAGADVLYAPGIRSREHIEAVVRAAAPKPVNVIIAWDSEFTVDDLTAMGVRRISVGSAPARLAWAGMMQAMRGIAEKGSFKGFAYAAPSADLNALFREDLPRRSR